MHPIVKQSFDKYLALIKEVFYQNGMQKEYKTFLTKFEEKPNLGVMYAWELAEIGYFKYSEELQSVEGELCSLIGR